jgi:hypothetical protein
MVMKLGEIMMAHGVLCHNQVAYGLLRQSRCRDHRFGELMESFGFASSMDVDAALAEQLRQRQASDGAGE